MYKTFEHEGYQMNYFKFKINSRKKWKKTSIKSIRFIGLFIS